MCVSKHSCAAADNPSSGWPQPPESVNRHIFAAFEQMVWKSMAICGCCECQVSCIFPVYGRIQPKAVTILILLILSSCMFGLMVKHCLHVLVIVVLLRRFGVCRCMIYFMYLCATLFVTERLDHHKAAIPNHFNFFHHQLLVPGGNFASLPPLFCKLNID